MILYKVVKAINCGESFCIGFKVGTEIFNGTYSNINLAYKRMAVYNEGDEDYLPPTCQCRFEVVIKSSS